MSASGPSVRVGVAGLDYPDWLGVVYPADAAHQLDRLRYLAGFVGLIEINSSFYGPPRPRTAEVWVERVSDLPKFRFTAKLWRRFTHDRGEAWTRTDVADVRGGFDPLLAAGRLDAVLAQFPMSFKNGPAEREWLTDVVRTFRDFPLVVEVRHASWNEPDFYGWLAEEGVGFVNIDQPLFHRCLKPSARGTARVAYVRVHGRNYQDWFRRNAGKDARYDYLYTPEKLEPWVERTRELAEAPETATVDVVFNNHYRGKAVVNALQFAALLSGREQSAPAALVDAYPDALAGFAAPVVGSRATTGASGRSSAARAGDRRRPAA